MSASREKRARKGTQEEILNQQQIEAAKKHSTTKKNVTTGVIIFLVVALLIGSIVLFRGPYFLRNTTALTVGDHKLTPVQVRYFYQDAFQLMINQGYGSMVGMMYGEGVEFQDEIVDETTGQTWADLILANAAETIRTTYAFYDLATAEGYTLSAEGEESLKTNLAMLDLYGQMYSMTGDDYVRSIYGNGASLESYEDYQRILLTVNEYQIAQSESYEYSESELNAKYEEDPSAFHLYTYHSFVTYAETTDENGNDLDEAGLAAAMEETKATVDAMAESSQGNLDAYLQACADLSGNESYLEGQTSLRSNLTLDTVSSSIREWVADPARQEGDTAAIELEGQGYYVVYWISSSDNDYDAYNIRSIKISANATDANGNAVVDWDAADIELQALQADIEASSDLMADFDSLASTYNDDANGSVYEYVYNGQFEAAVSDWLFGEAHEAGDNAIIQGEDAYYYIYVDGVAGNYLDYLVHQQLMLEDYNAWYAEKTATVTLEENPSGMKHVDTTLISPSSTAAY